MRDVLLVAIGGSLGALTRWGVGLAAAHLFGRGFPWGTLLVNVSGSFVMGIAMRMLLDLESQPPEALPPAIQTQLALWHKGVALGFLGALTTFSTFSGDTLRELQAGQPSLALANIAANVLLSLAAVWCGFVMLRGLE
ncbi:MAG: CrcB family protein [Pirellulaceae bacterium]|nr:CrcB family protein [Pirellulaceae bacterium]